MNYIVVPEILQVWKSLGLKQDWLWCWKCCIKCECGRERTCLRDLPLYHHQFTVWMTNMEKDVRETILKLHYGREINRGHPRALHPNNPFSWFNRTSIFGWNCIVCLVKYGILVKQWQMKHSLQMFYFSLKIFIF